MNPFFHQVVIHTANKPGARQFLIMRVMDLQSPGHLFWVVKVYQGAWTVALRDFETFRQAREFVQSF